MTDFRAPSSLEEALTAVAEEGTVALAGGTSLALMLRGGLIAPSRLVWLGRIQAFDGVEERDGSLMIGAGTTLDRLATDTAVRHSQPALAGAAAGVGNLRVRCAATLGGHVAHADPRQDLLPLLIALGATIRLRSANAGRAVPAEAFFTGFLETALGAGELITAVEVPALGPGSAAAYLRFNPGSREDYATVGAAAVIRSDGEGRIRQARVALAGVSDRPHVVSAAAGLAGLRATEADFAAVAATASESCRPNSDGRGSADYKRAMAVVFARRALEQAFASAYLPR